MEDIAVDAFLTSSFGTFVMTLWHGVLSAPSWQNFTYLAYGWALAFGRQTITADLFGQAGAGVDVGPAGCLRQGDRRRV